MESIISKLYYGEISPCEKPAPNTERFREDREIIRSIEDKLLEQFPKCKDLLNEYTDALLIEAQLEHEANYARSFRLGTLIMLEANNNRITIQPLAQYVQTAFSYTKDAEPKLRAFCYSVMRLTSPLC